MPYYQITSSSATWVRWNHVYTSTTTSATSPNLDVWATWLDQGTSFASGRMVAQAPRSFEEQRREQEAARAVAQDLLLSLLTEEQREDFERLRRFSVVGADGHLYRIYRNGKSGNVRRIEGGHEVEQFCIHDYDGLPDEDTYVAQMLLLQTDPAAFRRIANVSRIRVPA